MRCFPSIIKGANRRRSLNTRASRPPSSAGPSWFWWLFHIRGILVAAAILLVWFASCLNIEDYSTLTRLLPVMENRTEAALSSSRVLVDMLSIGSISRPDYQEAQKNTFGAHPSVRTFFNVTELDDVEQHCADQLSTENVVQISEFCRRKHWRKEQFLMSYLRGCYASQRWLRKKKNPPGWMCAQKRPIHGLTKVVRRYRQQQQQRVGDLPDFLVIFDDDTYYNMELVEPYLNRFDPNTALAIMGCVIRSPIKRINLTIPFGGWGVILSRGVLRNLMRPVYCQRNSTRDTFEESACRRLEEDQLGEKYLFKDGMSISDLMEAYAKSQLYTSVSNWTHGFCIHSDWAWGLFLNLYNISVHSASPAFESVPHDRLRGYMDSEIYAGKQTQEAKAAKLGQCDNDSVEKCSNTSHICHYQTPESMKRLSDQVSSVVQYQKSY